MTNTADNTEHLVYALRVVTEDAAIASYDWVGRSQKETGDGAAVDAMRTALNKMPISGKIIIGEGEKDEAPMLYQGEEVGAGGRAYDIAVDPIEGTSYMAKGLPNAMATICMTPAGAMMDPGPAYYMEKLAVPAEAKGKIDPAWPTAKKLEVLAECLGKAVKDLTVYVLEKPRHKTLIKEINAAGARVALYPAGDVAGALLAVLPDSGIDALMGTGGSPEGILTATAIKAMGGDFMGRIDPQFDDERKAVADAGMDTDRWYALDDLVAGDEAYFCATGITDGLLFDGVSKDDNYYRLQSLLISSTTGGREILTRYKPL